MVVCFFLRTFATDKENNMFNTLIRKEMNTINIYTVDVTAKKAYADRFYYRGYPTTLRFYVPAVSAKDAASCIREMMTDGELLSTSHTNISKWYIKPFSTRCSAYTTLDIEDIEDPGYLECRLSNEFTGFDMFSSILEIHPARTPEAYASFIRKYAAKVHSYWQLKRDIQYEIASAFRDLAIIHLTM